MNRLESVEKVPAFSGVVRPIDVKAANWYPFIWSAGQEKNEFLHEIQRAALGKRNCSKNNARPFAKPAGHAMVVIGILGGVASGKSLVTQQLRQLGAEVLDADRAGHEVLREPEVERAIKQRWGDGVFGDDGHVNRAAVAKIVFGPAPQGPQELSYLEQITHPRIGQRLQSRLSQLALNQQLKAVVLDAPVMLKAGWDRYCDRILFVAAPRGSRLARSRSRGWTDAEFAAREAAQESLAEKQARADLVIDNSGTPEQTFAQVQSFWRSLD